MTKPHSQACGVDVGGTSIKAAVIEISTGQPVGPIVTTSTPANATPNQVAQIISDLAAELHWTGPIGCALPGVMDHHSLRRAPNLSPEWETPGVLRNSLGSTSALLNDADAVGLAELHYGLETPAAGLTIVLTFGTGIGSALLYNNELIPNSELGELGGTHGTFEAQASGRAISQDRLTPRQWSARAQPYFNDLDRLLNPVQWVAAGGLSVSFDDYFANLHLGKPIRVAHLAEHAGIVGAALAAHH